MAILLVLSAGAAAAGFYFFRGLKKPFSGPTWEVREEVLQVTIVERGTLESAENSDVICRVKAGSKGTSATTIKWVIEDGSHVQPNDVLMLLDDSALQDQLKTQINVVNNARAAWIQAKENCAIVDSQNYSDIETAKVAKTLSQLDLRKYVGGTIADKILKTVKNREDLQVYLTRDFEKDLKAEEDALELALKSDPSAAHSKTVSEYLQARSEIRGRLNDARSTTEQAEDRAAWSQRMVKKGYLSRSQSEADQARLDSAKNNYRKIQLELEILHKYTLEKTVTDFWSKVKEAERAVDRVETQNKAKKVQAETDRDNKETLYLQEDTRKEEIEGEIAKCTILSPQQGLVVFYVPEQSRFGSGSQQSIIAQGEPVREGQKLMRIPNLSRMLVNTRVHEAMVSRIRGEVSRSTGFTEAVRGASFVSQRPLDLLLKVGGYYALQDKVRDTYREVDHKVIYPGHAAKIRVEAFPGKLYSGNVKSVANVASQADFLSSDVKVYQTMVSIKEVVENLKPGMSAEVTILADQSSEKVKTVPIQAVVGSILMGAKRKVFVLEEGQPKMRDIEVGISNDQVVEVRSGLEVGDKVVLNPRPLLDPDSDMKPAVPGSKRGANFEEGTGNTKKKKKAPNPAGPAPEGFPGQGPKPGFQQSQAPKTPGEAILDKKGAAGQ